MAKDKSIKTLLISFYYNNKIYSGANKRFDETGKFLKRNGYDVKIVVLKGNIPKWCAKNEVVEFETSFRGIFKRLHLLIKLSRFLNKEPESVIISDFLPVPNNVFKRHNHYQLVHDLRYFTKFNNLHFPFITRNWLTKQWNKSQKVLTVSHFTKNQLNLFCSIPADNVLVSWNGIEPSYLEKDVDGPRALDFLYIAHFEDRKNHPVLVRALAELKKRGIESKTVLIGKDHGTLPEVQRLIAEHKLSDFIEIKDGSFSEQELIKMYLSSKVFVSPARYEGFGMPIIEALASGCMVCCSDIEVFHEVAEESALYFDPENEQDIADVLSRALKQNVNRDHLRSMIKEKYTWDKTLIPILDEIKRQ